MFPKVAAPKHDELVPDPQAQRELNITAMTMWRWDRDQTLIEAGWPPPIRIRNRKFRSRQALEEFKSGMARRAIAERAKTEGEAAAPELRGENSRAWTEAEVQAWLDSRPTQRRRQSKPPAPLKRGAR